MTKIWILPILILFILIIFLTPYIWNFKENGPDINRPSIFFGCYGPSTNRLIITHHELAIDRTGQKTPIVRFFYLKTEAAIELVQNLELDANGDALHVGEQATGFFYNFDSPYRPTALLIPDDEGTLRRLDRVKC